MLVGRIMSGWMHGCGNAHCVKPFCTCLPACTSKGTAAATLATHQSTCRPTHPPARLPPVSLAAWQCVSAGRAKRLWRRGPEPADQPAGHHIWAGPVLPYEGCAVLAVVAACSVHHARVSMRAAIKDPAGVYEVCTQQQPMTICKLFCPPPTELGSRSTPPFLQA